MNNERGVALLIVLIVVSVLGYLVFDFSYFIRVNLSSAENFRNGTQAYFLSRSGIEACRALLKENKNSYDAFSEMWATERPPVMAEGGIVEIFLIDENRKINVNNLAGQNKLQHDFTYQQIERLLGNLELDVSIAAAILDWVDEDSTGSAENPYYQSLQPPYRCKNGPVDSMQELLMVRDINDEIYYGTKERMGLRQLLTNRGNGKININTADLQVLMSLHDDLTDDIAGNIMIARDTKPFRRIEELKERRDETGVDTRLFNEIVDYIAVVSDAFTAQANASVGEYTVSTQAVLDRFGQRIYFWKRL